ncbi:flagellar biosynthesis protein FlhF [Saccharospirillum sp. MSK14-1]|uniref:flagellar biosynthesis protein FlhF n=1 Tax=Saccharospirillum sp. MSK14-1 TaxID=1897632 RepID=UPI000D38DB97|nr:flagellar biosynthesis protein FlhF [Saccharospirillum sp. MSK14-1]PTY36748.1 flagellar biosynthesis protein FlhF [Saccharospirillum sp. MSK14-1]
MKVKRFVVASMQVGLKQVAEALGPEAVILSTRKLPEGTEIVAGVDEAEFARFEANRPAAPDPEAIIKAHPRQHDGQPKLDTESLKGLLENLAPHSRAAFGDLAPERPAPADTTESAPDSPLARAMEAQQRAELSAQRPAPKTETQPTPLRAQSDEELMSLMRQEIDSLRQMLKQQTDFLQAPVMGAQTPQLEKLEGRLRALGLSESVQRSLLRHYDRDAALDANWRRLLARLASGLSVPVFDPLTEGGVVALCGPTGAGKTTTLAKLAARAVKRRGHDKVAVVSTDCYQLGAQDTLESVSQILGVDYRALGEDDSLAETLESLSHYHLVLVDTSGSADALRQWQAQVVDTGLDSRIQSVLVMPATANCESLNQFIQAFPSQHLAGAIITKLDEAPCFGSVFDSLLRHRWPLWYNTDGQRIPQDIDSVDPVRLVKRLARALDETRPGLAQAS